MVEIVLVLNPCWDVETAPIGLGYLAEYVRSHGFECRILDLNLAGYVECGCQDYWQPQLHKYWMDRALFKEVLAALDDFLEHWAGKLAEEEDELIGFSVNAASRYFTVEMARRIRALAPDKILVWGGPGVYNAEELVSIPSHLADCVVIGEGEQTLLEIMQCLNTSRTLPDGIPGTAMPHGDTFRFNPRRQEIPDLDSLPFPSYEGFPLDYYTATHAMPVLMSRGCPMRCAFCDTTLRFKRFRYRSAQNIMKEITFHSSRRLVGTVVFHDALLNGNVKMLGALMELIIASPLRFQWLGNFVVNKRCTPEFYRLMKRAGCTMLMYGIESGSDLENTIQEIRLIGESNRFRLNDRAVLKNVDFWLRRQFNYCIFNVHFAITQIRSQTQITDH